MNLKKMKLLAAVSLISLSAFGLTSCGDDKSTEVNWESSPSGNSSMTANNDWRTLELVDQKVDKETSGHFILGTGKKDADGKETDMNVLIEKDFVFTPTSKDGYVEAVFTEKEQSKINEALSSEAGVITHFTENEDVPKDAVKLNWNKK